MNEDDKSRSLIPRADVSLVKATAGPKRVLADMVGQTLVLVRQEQSENDAEEQYQAGERCFYGDDVPQDFVEAVLWYRKAAEQGHVFAQVELGSCYDFGFGVEQDDQQARYWYLKAADQGHVPAMRKLGVWYEWNGAPVGSTDEEQQAHFDHSREQASKWFKNAAWLGDTLAKCRIGGTFDTRTYYFDDDAEEATIEQLRALAEQGDAAAQWKLGVLYEQCDGKRDYEEMEKWYRKAAEQGNAEGQWRLGSYYESRNQRNGVSSEPEVRLPSPLERRSIVSQMPWRSSEEALAQADRLKEASLKNGRNQKKDAAEEDAKKAAYWYRKSAEQGNVDGMWGLARMQQQDLEQYRLWLQKAVEQGHPDAGLRLAMSYRDEPGKDLPLGFMWYRILADYKGGINRVHLDRLLSLMSPDELRAGLRMYREARAQMRINRMNTPKLSPELYKDMLLAKAQDPESFPPELLSVLEHDRRLKSPTTSPEDRHDAS